MDLVDMLAGAHGGQGLETIGRQFGLDASQTRAAIEQLAPVVAAGVRRNAQSPDGLVNLLEALSRGQHEHYLDDPQAVQLDNVRDDGNAILGHVLGSKEVSREVAMRAAGSSGIGAAILKQLLPIIAAMVVGSLTKKMGGGTTRRAPMPDPEPDSGGGLGDILGDILGGGQQTQGDRSGQGGGLGDILGDILGGGRQQAPQPAPAPQPRQGGSLDDLLRDILGGGAAPQGSGTPAPGGYNEDAARRGRTTLDDILGGGTKSGNAADDLLNSVERHLRRR